MDVQSQIDALKRQLNQLMSRPAQPQPRPQLRRARIIEVGTYDCHKIEFRDGKFTEDLTTDDLSSSDRGEPAFVGDDFDRQIFLGDKVFVSLCEGRYWIVGKEEGCIGYCIDDPQDTAYVWGWFFNCPPLECCPEAGGPQLLTTSDGSTYETATFKCNATGDNRKWIFDGTKLYISPMLDEGNVQFQTDQTPANCTVVLQKYEGLVFPVEQCGPIPNSICLHPLCGNPGCDDCDHGTPLIYEANHGGNLRQDPDAVSPPTCMMNTPLLFHYEQNVLGNCAFKTNQKSFGYYDFEFYPEGSPPYLFTNSGTGSVSWEMDSGPFDYYGENVFSLVTDVSSNKCIGWPETITVRPRLGTIVEANCNPLVWRIITEDGFAHSSVDEVVCWEVPRYWFLEVSGVTNDSCSDCDVFNSSFILDYFTLLGPFGQTDDITTTCATGSPFTVQFSRGTENYPTNDWYLYVLFRQPAAAIDDSYAVYKKYLGTDAHGINCVGANELTLDAYTGDCQNWPATLTIRPLI